MFISTLISAVLQVVLFGLIPLVWWLAAARGKEGFLKWLGFKGFSTENWRKYIALFLIIFAVDYLAGVAESALLSWQGIESADSQFAGIGAAAIPCVIIYAFIQTGLSEEIFFRGFLLKRLSNKFGFRTANIVQAVIFGLLHLAMAWGQITPISGVVITVYPLAVALTLGYINEKKSEGSIIPSWLIHGSMNVLSGISQVF